MNATTNTEKKKRGRPRIHATINDLLKQTNVRRKERDPEAYRAHGSRNRGTKYCEVCEKTYHALSYKSHLDKRNHLKNLAKKEESSSNETVYISE